MNKKKINLKEYINGLHILINNMTIKTFHFNFIQVNTYVLHDETKEAVIIDPGNYDESENEALSNYIDNNGLTIKYIINTHPHIDHVLGNPFCVKKYRAPLLMHKAGMSIYENAYAYGTAFGFNTNEFPQPTHYMEDGEKIGFGNQMLKVLYTPGHADGSVSLYDESDHLVFVGDVLFEDSIGRTDLPSGNYDILMQSIKNKLFTLPDDTEVFCGHGLTTTIEHEKNNNPFIK